MKMPHHLKSLVLFLLFLSPAYLYAQPSNNAISSATVLTSGLSCTTTSGTLSNGVAATGTTGISTFCTATATSGDVWYYFVAQSTFPTVTVSNMSSTGGSSMDDTPGLQIFNTNSTSSGIISTISVATLNSTWSECTNGTSVTSLSLTPSSALTTGNVYLVRVMSTTTAVTTTSSKWSFDICVTDPAPPPANDDCANATSITPATGYVSGTSLLTSQTLAGATVEGSGIATSCGGSTLSQDVWYKFVASNDYPIIKVLNQGSSWSSSLRIQLLLGSCGSFSEVGCSSSATLTPSSALNLGSTYYIRILKNNTTAPTGSNWGFDIAVIGGSSRMSEVFKQTTLSGSGGLSYPWEITYGPDNYLWITEAHGYKVWRMDPSSGTKTTVLDVSQTGSGYLTATEHTNFNVQFSSSQSPWPQGGFAGLALHPKFLDPVAPKNYVYVSYVRTFISSNADSTGEFFTNRIVRFTYNTSTGHLENPVSLCDTIPGSSDHNSQRLIIAPVSGTYYLFYGAGDMGAGQFKNKYRPNKAQNSAAYEGKILRFNLEADTDGGTLDKWIPNDNPFNGASQSAVWATGIRNNQGFAYDTTSGILFGSSHGPYSDDEINVILRNKNYGHPLVIGYASDGNYNTSSAGAPNSATSACPVITDEVAAAAAITNYKDPLFSGYAPSLSTLHNIWLTNPGNGGWPSEAWSGMDFYNSPYIPGWKNSLVIGGLKWGRVIRLKVNTTDTTIVQTNGADTVTYFGSTNRYRDVAFLPSGKDIFVIMDNNSTTSGPGAANPVTPACPGCVIKYTFLGYADASGKSSIPDAIDITTGTAGACTPGTSVTVDNNNNNLWVPITGPDGNVLAEIYPNGNNLGAITSSFYINSGAVRQDAVGRRYLNRNITITPAVQPSTSVKVRLYLTNAEFTALQSNPFSGVSTLSDLLIRKNSDACGSSLTNTTTNFTPSVAQAHGTGGYVLQYDNIPSFSSFYIGSNSIILPVNLLSFTGSLQNNTTFLNWETSNETNTSAFIVERSIDGHNYTRIGTVAASGNSNSKMDYNYTDYDVMKQSSELVYYRLKMVDGDGGYKYSNVVTITLPYVTGRINVFPNPASKEVNVTVAAPADGNVNWQLLDNTGRVILHNNTQMRKGNNNFSIRLTNIAVGIYYLKISGAGVDQQVKLQKL